jgi:hypothetical protein
MCAAALKTPFGFSCSDAVTLDAHALSASSQAYAGSNTKIRETLKNLILKSPQSWQTSIGLPFFQIQGTVVEWDECVAQRKQNLLIAHQSIAPIFCHMPYSRSFRIPAPKKRRIRFDVRLMQRVPYEGCVHRTRAHSPQFTHSMLTA